VSANGGGRLGSARLAAHARTGGDGPRSSAAPASGWRTSEPSRNVREQGAATTTAGWRTSEPALGPAGEEFARIVFELLWSEGSFGSTDVSGGRPLECVWSSLDGCSCGASIPTDAVARAWERELDATGELEDRFFHFIWEGGFGSHSASPTARFAVCTARRTTARAQPAPRGALRRSPGAGEIVCELALAA